MLLTIKRGCEDTMVRLCCTESNRRIVQHHQAAGNRPFVRILLYAPTTWPIAICGAKCIDPIRLFTPPKDHHVFPPDCSEPLESNLFQEQPPTRAYIPTGKNKYVCNRNNCLYTTCELHCPHTYFRQAAHRDPRPGTRRPQPALWHRFPPPCALQ